MTFHNAALDLPILCIITNVSLSQKVTIVRCCTLRYHLNKSILIGVQCPYGEFIITVAVCCNA